MKKYNSMYLGICINNNDPEKRGRVQIFIPHIMPTLYKGWNEDKQDINIACVGDNMPDGLSTEIVNRLSLILPWAEAASPVVGTSAPGNLLTSIADTANELVQGAKGIISSVFDQSPVAEPANIQDLQGLYKEAANWVGNDERGKKCQASYSTNRGPGNCLRGSQGILGALTGHPRFNAGKAGGLGLNATLYSGKGGQDFTGTGLYNAPTSIPTNYMGDSSQWQVGDTVVCAGGSEGHGHIQVWTGKAWVSDFTQKGVIQQSNYNSFVLHRPNEVGKAKIAERASSLIGGAPAGNQEATSISGEVAAASPHQSPTPIATDPKDPQYGSIANPNTDSTGTGSQGTTNLTLSKTQQNAIGLFKNNYQKNYSRYEAVSNQLKSKGYSISPAQVAAFHWREGSGNFGQSIANGQTLNSYVRKDGRMGNGSPSNSFTRTSNWEENAVEVLEYKINEKYGPSGKSKDFSQNSQFYDFAERFNGMGYRGKGVASPYIWAGTDQYTSGKYTKDGPDGYDPNHVDQQPGIASLISSAEGTSIDVNAQALAGKPMSGGGGGLVNNTDPHGPITTQNLNNVAKGLFTYPAAGAMLWVFFREGNPLYPVYFAASYSKSEWSSAYGLASDGPGYRPTSTPDNQTTSTGGLMNLNGVGGLRWEHTTNPEDRISDQKSIMFFGEDGSNIFMGKGYNQYFSKFDRRDQVEGDRWETTLGFNEKWVQGDSNEVVMGDVFVKVGNVSQPAVDAAQRIQEIIQTIQQPLLQT